MEYKKKEFFPFNFGGLPSDRIFFTSDNHFLHANIIKYCNRPFEDTKEMNQVLVDRWNEVVGKDDLIFCLGDFALGRGKDCHHILQSLNGHKVLIKGNHEKTVMSKAFNRDEFDGGIYDLLDIRVIDDEVTDGFQDLILCHYPMLTWDKSHRGSWQLFGHVHGTLDGNNKLSPNQLDVGVDSHNYQPINYDRVKEIITINNLNRIKNTK
jgi:calcineurin-like phosphoesterase family protein